MVWMVCSAIQILIAAKLVRAVYVRLLLKVNIVVEMVGQTVKNALEDTVAILKTVG